MQKFGKMEHVVELEGLFIFMFQYIKENWKIFNAYVVY